MLDIRYHVASLVAVFIALGVGILIGSTLVGGDVMIEQQQKMISQLESQFNELRQRESEMEERKRISRQVNPLLRGIQQGVSPPLIKNRLSGYQLPSSSPGTGDPPDY